VSQVAAKRKIVLQSVRVKVLARFREQGSVLRGTAEGFCKGFQIETFFETEATEEDILGLIQTARKMCFTEAALAGEVELSHRYELNGQTITSYAQGPETS
jgi:hypothetical protein